MSASPKLAAAASFRDPQALHGASPSPSSPGGRASSSAMLLRKRKEPKNPLGAASKALGAVVDLGKKVRVENVLTSLHDALTGDGRKRAAERAVTLAPVGVTRAYSVLLTHTVAPLWSIGLSPTLGVPQPINFSDGAITSFCRSLDTQGWDLSTVGDALQRDMTLATAYVALLLARLLCLENGEWRLSFFELAGQITRDVVRKGDYEEHANDEQGAIDQPRRRLTEVGGPTWRARGAVELPAPLSHLRQQAMNRLMQCTVCFKYVFSDESVQQLADALSGQLYLVSYSESLVQLVAGIKGPNYLAKYFVHSARQTSERIDPVDGSLTEPPVASPCLESISAAVDIALSNIIHRNDTGEVVLQSLAQSLIVCPANQLRALLQTIRQVLSLVYVADLALLVPLLDGIRRVMLIPGTAGLEAREALKDGWEAARNIGGPSRSLMSRLFIAGEELRSFRVRPLHVLVSPKSARSFVLTKVFHPNVDQQRGLKNPMLPVALSRNVDPTTQEPIPKPKQAIDDVVLYTANHVCNIFQSALEVTQHMCEGEEDRQALLDAQAAVDAAEQRSAPIRKGAGSRVGGGGGGGALDPTRFVNANGDEDAGGAEELVDEETRRLASIAGLQRIDLATLFSVPPQDLCGFLPQLHLVLSPVTNPGVVFSDPGQTTSATYNRIADQYGVLVDGYKVAPRQRRFRLEAPRVPVRPYLFTPMDGSEEGSTTVRGLIDRYWKDCDRRVTEGEATIHHPRRDLSLLHFVENEIDVLLIGGSGTLRFFVESLLRLRQQAPGAMPRFRVFLVPAGCDNDVASWLARGDPLYLHRVFAPFTCLPTIAVDPMTVDTLLSPPNASFDSLMLRQRLNDYTVHAREENSVLAYQVECVRPDGSSVYIVMTSNFEFGAHVTAAVLHDSFSCSLEHVATQPYSAQSTKQQTTPSGGQGQTTPNPVATPVGGLGSGGGAGSPRTSTSRNRSFSRLLEGSMVAGGSSMALPPGAYGAPVVLTAQQQSKLRQMATAVVDQHSAFSLMEISAELREPIERILARMHAAFRGLPVGNRRHPSEARDVPFCCRGSDLQDWLGTTYVLYDPSAVASAAQRLLDRGVISCAAPALGRPADKFHEAALYMPRPREDADTVPLAAPTAKSCTFDLAMSMKASLEDAVPKGTGNAINALPLTPTAKIVFVPRLNDSQYAELCPASRDRDAGDSAMNMLLGSGTPTAATRLREVVTFKAKSAGSPGDRGPLPCPCKPHLQLGVYDMERKRAAATHTSASDNMSAGTAGAASSNAPPASAVGAPAAANNSTSAAAGGSVSPRATAGGGATGNAAATHGGDDQSSEGPRIRGQRPGHIGHTIDLGDHYTLRFGSTAAKVDPRCVLSVDIVDDGMTTAVGAGPAISDTTSLLTSTLSAVPSGQLGIHCAIDGDIFGPFVGFRLRPVVQDDEAVTVPVMSYLDAAASASL